MVKNIKLSKRWTPPISGQKLLPRLCPLIRESTVIRSLTVWVTVNWYQTANSSVSATNIRKQPTLGGFSFYSKYIKDQLIYQRDQIFSMLSDRKSFRIEHSIAWWCYSTLFFKHSCFLLSEMDGMGQTCSRGKKNKHL